MVYADSLINMPLLEEINGNFREAQDHTREWRREAREAYDLYAGDQYSDEDKEYLAQQKRPAIVFNRIAVMVDAVSGSEVNNRQEVRYIPREPGDVAVNEVYTGAARFLRDQCDAEDEESEAFRDTLICGMGWTETRIEYETDPDGMVRVERVDPLEMYWDKNARKGNLSDARWVFRVRTMTVKEFNKRWPGKLPDAFKEGPYDFVQPAENDNDPFKYDAERANEWYDPHRDRITVVEYQYFALEPFYRVANPTTGQIESLTVKAFKRLQDLLDEEGIAYVKQQRRVYRRAFACGNTILEEGLSPSQTGFTYKCITGKRDRNSNIWFGLVRPMKDPQTWANRWLSQLLHILNSQAKGGIMAETTAFADQREAEEKWASPDAIAWLAPGGAARVQPKPEAKYPVGIEKLTEMAISSLREVTGVNLELLGLAETDQAGVLEYQRKQAGITILATLFGALRRYRKEQGRLLLEYIHKYIADGRLIRIVGEKGERYVPLVRDPTTASFDVIVDDAPTSPDQREQVWSLLVQAMPFLMKAGLPLPPDILDYLPLPASLAQKWKEMIEQQAAQGAPADPVAAAKAQAEQGKLQIAQQKAQAEIETQQMKTETEKAKAEMQRAKAESEEKKAQLEPQLTLMEMQAEMQMDREHHAMEMEMEQQRFAADERRAEEGHKAQLQQGEQMTGAKVEATRRKGVAAKGDNKPQRKGQKRNG